MENYGSFCPICYGLGELFFWHDRVLLCAQKLRSTNNALRLVANMTILDRYDEVTTKFKKCFAKGGACSENRISGMPLRKLHDTVHVSVFQQPGQEFDDLI